ncbi:DUF5615 family PIN-like protein [uncultured Thiohalocapsa sp.]|uniref:DUF5615 family PIN-like protein n=1 Tax=uncultured Thiohalocapsa sp. TaxID=768990 RepID=UPI0034580C47
MTRILLDQGLPHSAVEHLAASGVDACHVADIGHSRASASDILSVIASLAQGHRSHGLTAPVDARGHCA